MNKLRKGDQVIVLTGRDKGKRGTIAARVDADHLLVVKIQAGHGIARFRLPGLFFDREHLARRIELDHAVALRVVHVIRKNSGTFDLRVGTGQKAREVVTVEDVVT